MASPVDLSDRVSGLEGRLSKLEKRKILTGVVQVGTLLAIISFAFWLGTLSSTVNDTSRKLDKLNDAVIGSSKDSLSNRLSIIETKLD